MKRNFARNLKHILPTKASRLSVYRQRSLRRLADVEIAASAGGRGGLPSNKERFRSTANGSGR